MILVRKKSDNGIWMSFEDSNTVTIDANGTYADNFRAVQFTSTDYELVTGVTDTDHNGKYGNGVYSWDGAVWALVIPSIKASIDAEKAANDAARPSE